MPAVQFYQRRAHFAMPSKIQLSLRRPTASGARIRSIYQMHSRTSWASNGLIHLVVRGFLFVQPSVLDVKSGLRTDTLYRAAAGKAGITYVDVWDGFADEAGRFLQRARTLKARSDSCALTTACISRRPGRVSSRNYVERDINRPLAARSAPISLPSEPAPDANALPDQPAPRPLAGPIVPLTASSVGTDQ